LFWGKWEERIFKESLLNNNNMKKTIINLLLLGTLALPINNLVGNFEKNITHNKPNYTLFLDAEKTEIQRMSKENLNQIFQTLKNKILKTELFMRGG